MSTVSDLEMFLLLHSDHGRLTPLVGQRTLNGHRLEVACACGVMLGRWVTPEGRGVERALDHLRAGSSPLLRRLLPSSRLVGGSAAPLRHRSLLHSAQPSPAHRDGQPRRGRSSPSNVHDARCSRIESVRGTRHERHRLKRVPKRSLPSCDIAYSL